MRGRDIRILKTEKIYDVVVVGGGAAGMTAAIFAAEHGAKVLILEHMERTGKKILATGNGKCNFTNRMQGVSHYRGDDPAFVMPVFAQFGLEQTLNFFEELGICPKEKNGYFYPASEQASSVLAVLNMRLERLHVKVCCEIGIRRIQKENGIFCFETKEGSCYGRTCILATGGYAAKKTGSDGSGFIYAKKFGHQLSRPVPALVQLIAEQPFEKEIAGVRTTAGVGIFADGKLLHQDIGELQLTDYGISGIPVFQVSRFAAKALAAGADVKAELDFFPAVDDATLTQILNKRFGSGGIGKNAGEALIGMFADKLSAVLLKRSKIEMDMPAKCVSRKQLDALHRQIKRFTVKIARTNKFDAAQVTAGGIFTRELDGQTLGSKLVKGLFFAGEMIDIDGECGGYNLQWAWSSGAVAGRAAADHAGKERKGQI